MEGYCSRLSTVASAQVDGGGGWKYGSMALRLVLAESEIYLLDIGTHDEVYR